MFIGLNPSKADEDTDDPTIRRCINFSKAWGYSGLFMGNLFAFRATDPRLMKAEQWPQSEPNNLRLNDRWLTQKAKEASVVVAAWGVHGSHLGRDHAVHCLMQDAKVPLVCLGKTKDGAPKHPLYIAADTPLIEYRTWGEVPA
jgi:hypothetical protein